MYGSGSYGGAPYGGIDQLGVFVPPPPPITETYGGIAASQVGEEYDMGLGYDRGTGRTVMWGYLLEPGTEWNEAPNLSDEQRIVQIASPNNSDRFTFYPKVSQDDWTGGEGQEYFTDPTKYYQSFKMDVTKPGHLAVIPDAVTIAVTPTGGSRAPVVSDGVALVAGLRTASPNALADYAGNLYYLHASGTPEPLFGLLDPQSGAFFATAAGTRAGIYRLPNVPTGGVQPVPVNWNADVVEPTATQALAYMSSPAGTGALYYIKNNNTIQQIAVAGAGTTVITGLSMEAPIRFLCSTATGLLYATQSANTIHQGQVTSILYAFDGATSTRIFDFTGVVRAGYELNGVTYLLLEYQQSNVTAPQFTLMAYSNGQLTTLFDQRYAAPDFQSNMATFASSPYGASLSGDGRFLYIGWPGYYGLAFDTVRSAFIRSGAAAVAAGSVVAHRLYPTVNGVIDIVSTATGAPTALTFVRSGAGSTVGTLTSSWIDFGTPGIVKAFRCVEVELQRPFPAGAQVQVFFRLDQQTSFTPLTQSTFLPNGNLIAFLPALTKGYRIQIQVGLTMVGTVSPVMRSIALTGNAARIWKLTLSCRRGQMKRNTQPDTQGTSTDLLANLLGAYQQGGYVSLFVPDPTVSQIGALGVKYVSLTTAKIEEYTWRSVVSPAYREDGNDDVGYAQEGVVDVTLAEQL